MIARAAPYALIVSAAVCAPLLLVALDSPLLQVSAHRHLTIFELVGLTGTLAALAIAALELRRRPSRRWRALLPVGLPLLLALHFLQRLGRSAHKPWDYDVYEYAARALLLGGDPYRVGLGYLYPPLTAQVLAAAYRAAARLQALLGFEPDAEAIWHDVFYLHQCAQLLLVLAAYGLCQRFARELGMRREGAHALAFLVLLASNALFQTLWNGQINLWLLDLGLVGLLLARRSPAACGLAIALGAHLKLYPLVLLWPLLVTRCVPALLWALGGLVGIALLQSDLGRDWTLLGRFAQHFASGSYGQSSIRNNSLYSVFWNVLHLTGAARPDPGLLRALTAASSLAVGAWLLLRTRAWERLRPVHDDPRVDDDRMRLVYGAEVLAFGLLLSPSVWQHEYLLATPLVIWAAVRRGRDRPLAVAVGALLALAVPTFGIFPLSYRCLAGLLVLLALTRPGAR